MMLTKIDWNKVSAPFLPTDRTPVLCHCAADDSVFLGFCIHPYSDVDRNYNILNWYKITGIHTYEPVSGIVTEWADFIVEVKHDFDEFFN